MKKLVQMRHIILLNNIFRMNRQSLIRIQEDVTQKIQIEYLLLDLDMVGKRAHKKIKLSIETKLIIEIIFNIRNLK
jgi:hypothetical protein